MVSFLQFRTWKSWSMQTGVILPDKKCSPSLVSFGNPVQTFLFKPKPVSYTHLTLPTNREV